MELSGPSMDPTPRGYLRCVTLSSCFKVSYDLGNAVLLIDLDPSLIFEEVGMSQELAEGEGLTEHVLFEKEFLREREQAPASS